MEDRKALGVNERGRTKKVVDSINEKLIAIRVEQLEGVELQQISATPFIENRRFELENC